MQIKIPLELSGKIVNVTESQVIGYFLYLKSTVFKPMYGLVHFYIVLEVF